MNYFTHIWFIFSWKYNSPLWSCLFRIGHFANNRQNIYRWQEENNRLLYSITRIDDPGLLYGYFQLLYFRENVIHPPWLPLNNLLKVGEQIFIYMMAMSCLNKLSFFFKPALNISMLPLIKVRYHNHTQDDKFIHVDIVL